MGRVKWRTTKKPIPRWTSLTIKKKHTARMKYVSSVRFRYDFCQSHGRILAVVYQILTAIPRCMSWTVWKYIILVFKNLESDHLKSIVCCISSWCCRLWNPFRYTSMLDFLIWRTAHWIALQQGLHPHYEPRQCKSSLSSSTQTHDLQHL